MGTSTDKIFISNAVVYIAGVEAPVHEVTVSYGDGQIPQATLVMPADPELARFGTEDRVPVVIFYIDQWYDKNESAKDINVVPRLLFDGEITGWRFSRSAYGSSIVFTCTHAVEVMGKMFAQFLLGDATDQTANNITSGGTVQGIEVGFPKMFPFILLTKGLFATSEAFGLLNRPFDFVQNLLFTMRMGGNPVTAATASAGKIPAVAKSKDGKSVVITSALHEKLLAADNSDSILPTHYEQFILDTPQLSASMAFFVKYNHKVKFDQRWIATTTERFLEANLVTQVNDIVDPSFQYIMNEIHLQALQGAIGSIFGSGDSFYQILQTFYSLVTYQILMLPTAQLLTAGNRMSTNDGIPTDTNTAGSTREKRLACYISKPTAYFTIPPGCNVLFPSMVRDIGYEENYSTQVTRTIAGSPYLDFLSQKNTNPTPGSELLKAVATANGWPIDVRKAIQSEKPNPYNLLLFPEEYFKGPVINRIEMPAWYRYLTESVANYGNDYHRVFEEAVVKSALGQEIPPLDSRAATYTEDEGVDPYAPGAKPVSESLLYEKLKKRGATDIYERFTRLKYHENRYGSRNGSVSMAFNPYIVPCYEFVYLDPSVTNMHICGYVAAVTHRISAQGGMSTDIQFTFGRTLQENYEGAIHDAIGEYKAKNQGRFKASFPPLPTKTLNSALQTNEGAGAHFKNLFYQGATEKKKAYFNYLDYIETTKLGSLQVPTAKAIDADTTKGVEVQVKLKKGNEAYLNNYDDAMRRVARPICTLDEYISFINGGRGLEAAKENMLPADHYGVAVPVVIKVYTADESYNRYVEPTTNTKGFTIKDSRKDWAAIIKRYRLRVHNKDIQ